MGGAVEVVIDVVYQKAFKELVDGVLIEPGIQKVGHDLGPDGVVPEEANNLGCPGAINGAAGSQVPDESDPLFCSAAKLSRACAPSPPYVP